MASSNGNWVVGFNYCCGECEKRQHSLCVRTLQSNNARIRGLTSIDSVSSLDCSKRPHMLGSWLSWAIGTNLRSSASEPVSSKLLQARRRCSQVTFKLRSTAAWMVKLSFQLGNGSSSSTESLESQLPFYGFWAIPDAPTTSRSRWLKPSQKNMEIARMKAVGRKLVTLRTFKAIFTAWPVYLFNLAFICHVLGIRTYSYFNVWLKSTKRWSVEEVNLIPTAAYGTQIFFTLSYAWNSDALRMHWPVIIFACFIALTGCIILSVYPEHNIAAMMAG